MAILQADSPAPGPADVFATLALFQAAISYFTNESYDQTIGVSYSMSNGFYHAMGQRGANNGKLEPEEEAFLRGKKENGTISKAEMQKLKKHLKNTGEQHSRKSKGKKRNRNV